jgi:hypothetical protein
MQTVYWRRVREIESAVFAEASERCRLVCNTLTKDGRIVLTGILPAKEPTFSDAKIEFLGVRRVSVGREREGKVLEFCKTHGMPYETAIIACLHVLRHHIGPNFTFEVDEKSEPVWKASEEAIWSALGWRPDE